MEQEINGEIRCPVAEEWGSLREEFMRAMIKVDDTHDAIKKLLVSQSLYNKQVSQVASQNNTLIDRLVTALVDSPNNSNKSNHYALKVMGFVIIGLVLTLGSLLVGEKFEFIKNLIH